MEWAVDQLGNLIGAATAGALSYSLRCPSCRAPVFRKRGQYRRAHFSHYSDGGSPECEEYRPGQSFRSPEAAPSPAGNLMRSSQSLVRPSLRVSARLGGGLRLGVSLPILSAADVHADGELILTSSVGRRAYLASQLTRPNLIFLPPAIPFFKCEGTRDLGALAEQMKSLSDEFDRLAVFNDIDAGGRLLRRRESMLLKELYCVVSALPIPSQLAALTNGLEMGMIGSWQYARFAVPEHLTDVEKRVLYDLLDHEVGQPIARLEIIWPIPHHIDPDGAHVLPLEAQCLTALPIDCSAGGAVELRGGAHHTHLRCGNDPIDIDIRDVAEGILFLDGVEQFTIRRQECDVYAPEGVRVWKSEFKLIESSTSEGLGAGAAGPVLECPSERVAQFIARENERWSAHGHLLRLISGPPALDAGAFGRIHSEGGNGMTIPSPGICNAKTAWIESVLTAATSSDLLPLLPWGRCPNPNQLTFMLLERQLAWLKAHIACASERAA